MKYMNCANGSRNQSWSHRSLCNKSSLETGSINPLIHHSIPNMVRPWWNLLQPDLYPISAVICTDHYVFPILNRKFHISYVKKTHPHCICKVLPKRAQCALYIYIYILLFNLFSSLILNWTKMVCNSDFYDI